MAKITFTVPGKPEALKRHRTFKNKWTGKSHEVDPSEASKKDFLAKAMSCKPDKPFEGPIRMRTVFYFDRPKSHLNKSGVKKDCPAYKATGSDLSNLVKFVEDALNGIFYLDDRQVVIIESEKQYWYHNPCVYVEIEEL